MARHPYTLRLARAEDEGASWELEKRVWAPFNWLAEGAVGLDYVPDLHVVAVDEQDRLVATIDACGLVWDGDPGNLPPGGWRDVNLRAQEGFEQQPRWACALGASILPEAQRGGLSADLLRVLRDQALSLGYEGLVAPVRPSAKSKMPHLDISAYSCVRLQDGRHFDPWVRVHESLGGRILRTTERSMWWWGSREQWEEWLSMRLPDNGRLVPSGSIGWLTLVDGWGELVEGSIWILHKP